MNHRNTAAFFRVEGQGVIGFDERLKLEGLRRLDPIEPVS